VFGVGLSWWSFGRVGLASVPRGLARAFPFFGWYRYFTLFAWDTREGSLFVERHVLICILVIPTSGAGNGGAWW